MRAFQKDNVIRLLAITYKVERDKEYRSLRNAIASSYVPFGSTATEDRVASCASEEPDRASCNEKPDRNAWRQYRRASASEFCRAKGYARLALARASACS